MLIIWSCQKTPVDGASVPEEEKEGHAWLQEGEKPKDLVVIGSFYNGPAIVENWANSHITQLKNELTHHHHHQFPFPGYQRLLGLLAASSSLHL